MELGLLLLQEQLGLDLLSKDSQQVDQHREELKKRIDDIALAMIDEIKKKEAIHLNELKKRFPPFDYSKSLENELNEIEELFRDPNLLI